jgi:hypothetical protein
MAKHRLCPWCGVRLQLKLVQVEDKIRAVCSKCGWKIKEVKKKEPEVKVEDKKPEILEIKPEEVPETTPKPLWPLIIGAAILIIIIILFVKFVMLG